MYVCVVKCVEIRNAIINTTATDNALIYLYVPGETIKRKRLAGIGNYTLLFIRLGEIEGLEECPTGE